jgi:glycosyltransferase involved in cell wall biosynthesis
MAKIVFYCHDERPDLERYEYYKQDIDALRTLGHEVIICTKYREIPVRYDAMFLWWWTFALVPAFFSRMRGKPCIITGTFNLRFPPDFGGRDYLKRPLWQRLLISSALRLSTLNLFVSQFELDSCSRHFRISSGRYYPHVLNDDYLKGPSQVRSSSLLNIASSGKSNLIRKGIPDILRAIRLLKDEGADVHLDLAGKEGDGVVYLSEMIEQLEIGNEVRQLGTLDRAEKIRLLRACDIYVQPSRFEGFGLAIAEAMGCGACVVVCDVGAVREVVGDCGCYVAPGSPEDVARAIRELVCNSALRSGFQRSAHQRARRQFGFDTKVERLSGYLAEIGFSQGS